MPVLSKIFILSALFSFSLFGSEAAFIGPFGQIESELTAINSKRAELASNFEKLRNLSAKNALLESEIAETLQQIARGADFNTDVQNAKIKSILLDQNQAEGINTGYRNINNEIEKTWKVIQ
ncbi:MAG: hypothetical protein PHT07_10575 [Paludibacter sp.]|nr:hypothetical protein [Paludibacter sp.]